MKVIRKWPRYSSDKAASVADYVECQLVRTWSDGELEGINENISSITEVLARLVEECVGDDIEMLCRITGDMLEKEE